jgi:molybdopterin-guanine dinucleotide biosynthesis protein
MSLINERRRVIAVGGFSSNAGKTTLMCELLREFPGWEAIKTTRGHYRSCGKDPLACCVSHLLSDEPIVWSGRKDTYEAGKDTGRYWDAGAANVHWLIATDAQVETGISKTLQQVKASGVLVEGNSFTHYVEVDAMIIVVRESQPVIKRSAKEALLKATGLYVWRDVNSDRNLDDIIAAALKGNDDLQERALSLPCYTLESLPDLVFSLRESQQPVAA